MIELLNNELAFVNGGADLERQFACLNANNAINYQSAYRFASNLLKSNPKLFNLLGYALTTKSFPADGSITKQYLKRRGEAQSFFRDQLVKSLGN